jgi:hypothetical protein
MDSGLLYLDLVINNFTFKRFQNVIFKIVTSKLTFWGHLLYVKFILKNTKLFRKVFYSFELNSE